MEVKESLEAKVVRLEVEIQQQVLLFTYCARIFFCTNLSTNKQGHSDRKIGST